MKNKLIIIKTTTSSLEEANKISNILLEKKIAGCIQMHEITSNYIWENKICIQHEICLNIKTNEKFYNEICQVIKNNNLYKIPQIISIKINNIDESYCHWLESSLKK